MKSATSAETVIAKLEAEGYARQPMPFKIASVPFDFTAALRGPHGRSLDLVLVVDTLEDAKGVRIRQRIEAVSRALDVARSRLVVTTVLVGPPIPSGVIEAIGRVCRVLVVEPWSGETDDADLAVDDAVRVLLPLRLPDPTEIGADPVSELQRRLGSHGSSSMLAQLLEGAPHGAGSVRRIFADLLKHALRLRTSQT